MKTTAKHFAVFQKECRKWLDRFGLKGWRVEFVHDEGNIKDTRAWSQVINIEDRVALLALSPDWGDDKVTTRSVRISAFHEVMELFLWRFEIPGTSRYVTAHEFTEERHAIIRTLENVFFEAR